MKQRIQKKTHGKMFWSVILTVLLVFTVLHGIVDVLGMNQVRTVNITVDTYGDIIRADGEKQNGLKPEQWQLAKGDQLIMHVPLPSEAPFESTAVVFHQYNSILTASIDGKIIYSYGQKLAQQNRQIGNILVSIVIPEDAWGKQLTVTAVAQERLYNSHITEFSLVPSQQVSRYPLIERGAEFILFLMLMTFGLIACMAEIAHGIVFHSLRHTGSLGLFCLLIGAWYFGYNRLFYAIVPNIRFNSMVEYYALDLVLIPLLGIMHYFVHRKISRRIIYIMTGATASYCGLSLILSSAGLLQLSDLLPGLQLLIAVLMVVMVITLIIDSRSQNRELNGTLLSGIAFAMVFAVIQVIAIRVQGTPGISPILRKIAEVDYAAVGLILLITEITVSIAGRYMNEFRERTEKEELEKLAYLDILTGLENRASCVKKLRQLKAENSYTIGFFDVDGLKKANDTYGHEAGDALIHGCATCLKNAFDGMEGFFGRWGGDEFIACFFHSEDAALFEKKLREELKEENTLGNRVLLSVSSGYMTHEKNDSRTSNEIIDMADEKMYQNKIARKKNR